MHLLSLLMDKSKILEFLSQFKESKEKEIVYPVPLTKKERMTFHETCKNNGLFSESDGDGIRKLITVSKEKKAPKIIITDEDRQQFIGDHDLPIPTSTEPFFSYFIELYNEKYGTGKKWELFLDANKTLRSMGKTLKSYSYELMERIVAKIKEVPEYKTFVEPDKITKANDKDPNQKTNNIKNDGGPKQKTIYNTHAETTEQYYISCDIIKANFTAMKYFNPKIVLDCQTWDELINKVITLDNLPHIEYFVQSKHFRQIVFGHLKGKRIGTIEKELTTHLYSRIKDNVPIHGNMSNDELFVKSSKETIKNDVNKVTEIVNSLPDNMKCIWRITPLCVKQLGKSECFVKKIILDIDKSLDDESNFKVNFMNISKDFHAQAFKFYYTLPLVPYDMKGMKDGHRFTYDEEIDFS